MDTKQRADMPLKISSCKHYFQYEDGSPFFWLADVAWMLFNKLKREEARQLFADRAAKGFNIIQTTMFRDLFSPNTPNAYGVRPFLSEADMYSARLNPDWMVYVREVTNLAAEHGLKLALLPTWGDKWNECSNSAGPVIFDTCECAHRFGREVSDALGDCANIIWIMGGDSDVQCQQHANVIRAMAEGIRSGAGGERLIGFHPAPRSAEVFHGEAWLDFNSIQPGHSTLDIPAHFHIAHLRDLPLVKPCVTIEPNFEGMDLGMLRQSPHQLPATPTFNDYDVRKAYYRTTLAGAAGFSYGHESIRQIYRNGDRRHRPFSGDLATWDQALSAPAASQMKLLAEQLLSRDYFSRIPAQDAFKFEGVELLSLFHKDKAPLNSDYFCPDASAARCSAGSYLMVYTPVRQVLQLDTSLLSGRRLRVSIFNPETGEMTGSYEIENTGIHRVVPERNLDTFLVLES